MNLVRSLIPAVAMCLAATQADVSAQEADGLTRLATGDDTRGWEAVGRVNFGDTGFCSGALISDRLVLTAAHCLYDTESGARVDPADMQFLVGLRAGRAEAYRGVRLAVSHPDYVFGSEVELDRVAVDLAVLELDRPVRTSRITPFEVAYGPMEGEPVGVVSYAKDRAEAPSLQRECHVLEERRGVAMLSCTVDYGASGAPVFRFAANGPMIVSVVSAKADAEGERVSLASAFGERFEELMDAYEQAPASPFGRELWTQDDPEVQMPPTTEDTAQAPLPGAARASGEGALNSGGATVRRLEVGGDGGSSAAKFLRP